MKRLKSIPSLQQLIKEETRHVDDLSTDAQTLFGLLTLIIDIKYRVKYGSSLGECTHERYSKNTMKKVVADQITPVDNGLLRH